MNKRNETLLEVIRQGLEVSGERQSEAMLGNRSSYIGLSDLAKYAECPRAQGNCMKRLCGRKRYLHIQ